MVSSDRLRPSLAKRLHRLDDEEDKISRQTLTAQNLRRLCRIRLCRERVIEYLDAFDMMRINAVYSPV
jgi:hypothetical protein